LTKEGHVYDVVIVGGGQSGLGTAFGLMRERITNFLVIDENPEGFEGPWITYARMYTLRTPKELPSIDLGVPSLTFKSWYIAKNGAEAWEKLDKIPRTDWMEYLKWYRNVLKIPVKNEVKLDLIEPTDEGYHKLHVIEKVNKRLYSQEKWYWPQAYKAVENGMCQHLSKNCQNIYMPTRLNKSIFSS